MSVELNVHSVYFPILVARGFGCVPQLSFLKIWVSRFRILVVGNVSIIVPD